MRKVINKGESVASLAQTVTHLSDGCAELTLKDLLQRLELVARNITWFLQLLQQLDGPGNIWQEEAKRVNVRVCVCVDSHGEGERVEKGPIQLH